MGGGLLLGSELQFHPTIGKFHHDGIVLRWENRDFHPLPLGYEGHQCTINRHVESP
jgi:hypothetical protein